MKNILRHLVVTAALLSVLTSAHAQSSAYPSRAVTIIYPGAPGGGPDAVVRMVANRLAQRMGAPFVVDNRAGAGGTIGATIAAKAAPDGYTLALLSSQENLIGPHIYLNLSYNVNKDFIPLVELATIPTVLAVNADLPVKSLTEFVAYAKANSGSMNYGTSGSGSIHHLTMGAFLKVAGIKMTHIPYKGAAQTVPALLAGDIQAAFVGIPAVSDFASTGRLKLLAISSSERSPAIPSVATLKELGFNVDLKARTGLFTQVGVSNDIRAKLYSEVKKVLAEPEIQKRVETLGMTASQLDQAQFSSALNVDYQNFGIIVRDLGLKAE